MIRLLPRLWRDTNPLSGKSPAWVIALLANHATEDERGSEYFAVAIDNYPIDTFSNSLRSRFSDVDFASLKELHELRGVGLSRFTDRLKLGRYVGIVLAAAAFLLDRVPSRVVESPPFNLAYGTFEVGVFWVTIGVLGYLLILLAGLYWVRSKYERAKQVHEHVETLLAYTELKYREAEQGR